MARFALPQRPPSAVHGAVLGKPGRPVGKTQPGMPGQPGMPAAPGMALPPAAGEQQPVAAGGMPADVNQLPSPPPIAGPEVTVSGEAESSEDDDDITASGEIRP